MSARRTTPPSWVIGTSGSMRMTVPLVWVSTVVRPRPSMNRARTGPDRGAEAAASDIGHLSDRWPKRCGARFRAPQRRVRLKAGGDRPDGEDGDAEGDHRDP